MIWVLNFLVRRTRELEEETFKIIAEGCGSKGVEHNLYCELDKEQTEIMTLKLENTNL